MKRTLKVLGTIIFFFLMGSLVVLVTLTVAVRLPGEERVPAGYPRNQAVYVKMRDGVEIAVDVWLPPNLKKEERVPVLLRTTRYWRAEQPRWLLRVLVGLHQASPAELLPKLNLGLADRNFVVIIADARGTGASGGSRQSEFSPEEIQDLGELVDWAASQPWSNGKVGTFGISCEGAAAELTAVSHRKALGAVAALFPPFDVGSLIAPGGVSTRFVSDWSAIVAAMDRNDLCAAYGFEGWSCVWNRLQSGGIKPVDADPDGKHLRDLIAQRHNADPAKQEAPLEFADDTFATSNGQFTLSDISVSGHLKQIEAAAVPMQLWCGWLDSQLCEGSLKHFRLLKSPQELMLSALSHGGSFNTDPFATDHAPVPSHEEQVKMLAEFFDKTLRKDSPEPVISKIRYYTMGENTWQETTSWPPEHFQTERFFFAEGHRLARTVSQRGSDQYSVDFSASTGESSRWFTSNGGGDVVYGNRSNEDKKLLTYTSDAFQTDVEITGAPVLMLNMTSTTSDGAVHAYLEDVAPDGQVTYLDEGVFRVIHRKLADIKGPCCPELGPSHSFARQDARPLVPGTMATIQFALYPTSILVRKGHQLRLALAGADSAIFRRYPANGESTWTIVRGANTGSYLEIPVRHLGSSEQRLQKSSER
jgi:putative CocE/NonD family hydrolase